MIYLRKIRLINWHYFTNESISIEGGCLITGDNGTGKSTILDAIQYVLVADLRDIAFNSSAHAETKRTLIGYLRCKTGGDTEQGSRYFRQGDISSYVVLEFFDTVRSQPFLVGVVADSYADNSEYRSRFFKIENHQCQDQFFIVESRPRNRRELGIFLRSIKGAKLYNTIEEYRHDLLRRFGIDDHRFFKLFVKAIAFKPITDIRQFVYSYVLDEKPIQIETMRETIRRYREYEELARLAKEKIIKLNQITELFEEITRLKRRINVQEYIIRRAKVENTRQEQNAVVAEVEQTVQRIEALQAEVQLLEAEHERLSRERDSLRIAIASDAAYQRKQNLEANRLRLREELHSIGAKIQQMQTLARCQRNFLEQLQNSMECDTDQQVIATAVKCVVELETGKVSDMEQCANSFSEMQRFLDRLVEHLIEQRHSLGQQLAALREEQQQVIGILRKLESNQRSYPKNVTNLLSAIKDHYLRKGKQIKVQPLCELLELKDESWRNAVEGYLNTQRFDLIVPPQEFDECLRVYEHYKEQGLVAGVGLVNTRQVIKYLNRAEENSLAQELFSQNRHALGYAYQLLGRVIKVDNEQELKRYRRAITRTCMTYQNNVARKIKPHVYATPYIGQGAIIRQIELYQARLSQLTDELQGLEQRLEQSQDLIAELRQHSSKYAEMRMMLDVFPRNVRCREELRQIEQELARLDLGKVEELKQRLCQCEQQLASADNKAREVERLIGSLEQKKRNLQAHLHDLEFELRELEQNLNWFIAQYPEEGQEGAERYEKEFRRQPLPNILNNFERSRKAHETQIAKRKDELILCMSDYNKAYQFGGRVSSDTIQDYEEERRQLIESELPEYEERIRSERERAEVEFKEHFIFKLKENIDSARHEFDRLNAALRGVTFGGESYYFKVEPAPEFRSIYDMIMDTDSFIFGGTGSIFNTAFQNKHRQAIDELFERIVIEDEQYLTKTINQYTDYRAYLKYDIRITSSTGEVSLYSSVGREKSGGETQTPFYIAIVASFLQLYRASSTNDTVRLLMFDEAFNRMDSERVESFMQFLSHFKLQPIVAAPTEKLQFIAPHLTTTLLVMRDGYEAWVEDFRQLSHVVAEVASVSE